jgi:membrane-associated phospholipid phosphatase
VNHKYRVWSWLLVLALVVAALGFAFWLDTFGHSWVLEHKNRSAEVFMRNVSRFGDWPEHVALGLILAGLAWWRGNKNWTRVFLSMLIACAIAGAAARVIKITTGRPRPSVKTEEVWNGPRLSEKFHAFPSGHMAASTAFWAILLFASWRIGLACLTIPLVIGASRMYVAAHYLSDVVFAGMLGLLVAYLVARFMLRQTRNPQSAIRI